MAKRRGQRLCDEKAQLMAHNSLMENTSLNSVARLVKPHKGTAGILDELSPMFQRDVDLHTPGFLSPYFRREVERAADVRYSQG
jgi:hypothetical protein